MIKNLLKVLPKFIYDYLLEKYHRRFSVMLVNGTPINMFNGIRKYSADKEPSTIEWIDSFRLESVFYDIGANVGAYSLYAAKKGVCKQIFAFEPGVPTFNVLLKNIRINSCSRKITPVVSPLDENSKFDEFYYSTLHEGGSQNLFGTLSDQNSQTLDVKQKHGVFGVSLDDLIYKYGLLKPDYLKIDVDGNDLNILRGGSKMLKELKPEIYIEYNSKNTVEKLVLFLSEYSYELVSQDQYDEVTGMVLFR